MENIRKHAKKRIEIVRTAAAAFQKRGYHGVSVEQIASELDMTKGNLYNYFKNKEEILYACHLQALDILLVNLSEIEKLPLSPEGKLRRLITRSVHLFMDEMQHMWTLELEALPPALLKRTVTKRDRVERVFRRVLRDGMNQSVFADADPKILTFAILGVINWIPRWYNPTGKATSHEIAEAFANCLVNGIVVRDSADRGTNRRQAVPSIIHAS